METQELVATQEFVEDEEGEESDAESDEMYEDDFEEVQGKSVQMTIQFSLTDDPEGIFATQKDLNNTQHDAITTHQDSSPAVVAKEQDNDETQNYDTTLNYEEKEEEVQHNNNNVEDDFNATQVVQDDDDDEEDEDEIEIDGGATQVFDANEK